MAPNVRVASMPRNIITMDTVTMDTVTTDTVTMDTDTMDTALVGDTTDWDGGHGVTSVPTGVTMKRATRTGTTTIVTTTWL